MWIQNLLFVLCSNIKQAMLMHCSKLCFFPALSVSNKSMSVRICKTASKITGISTQHVVQLSGRMTIRQATGIYPYPPTLQ